jgi:hypothetical protein
MAEKPGLDVNASADPVAAYVTRLWEEAPV